MTRGISEATDEHGVTHYLRGRLRFVKIAKNRRRKNVSKRGYYVTQDGCHWWCTGREISANTRATPGKEVDCMACLVRPPGESLPPFRLENMLEGRMPSTMISTPSYSESRIFTAMSRARPTRRVGRRR